MADMITAGGYRPDPAQVIGSIGKRVINLLPRNPLDKTTIVSVYPREIVDTKPTLFPSRFVIPPARDGGFVLKIIEGASYFIPSQIENQAPTEVQVNSMMLAESILHDSIPSMNLVTNVCRPGVFALPGIWNNTTVLTYVHPDGRNFNELLIQAREWQQNYWSAVMNEADYFWASTNGNPKSIPEDAKLAARILGIEKTKPWMNNVIASELVNCKACGEMINPTFPVCKFCHAITDEKRAKELNIQFAVK